VQGRARKKALASSSRSGPRCLASSVTLRARPGARHGRIAVSAATRERPRRASPLFCWAAKGDDDGVTADDALE
jgi:hypothetical protein